MATTRSSTSSGSTGTTPATEPERDYRNPGIFVLPRQPLFIVEDLSLARHSTSLPSVAVPWSALAVIKQYAPDQSRDLVVCGWDGVAQVLRQVEQAIIRQARERR